MRSFFLFLSKNKSLTKLAKRYGFKFGAGRFVAGETIEQASRKIKGMNAAGFVVTVDHLGEFIDNEQEARESAKECVHAITVLAKEELNAELSLKLTSIGLDISRELVMQNMRMILDVAKQHQVNVTIDMEDFERTEQTLHIFKELRNEYSNIGTVLQAYLYRVEADIEELTAFDPYLRLVKGAYKESHEVAFPEKKDVDENYRKIIKLNLLQGNYTAIATHDEAIINYVKQLELEYRIPKERFEFQMLYGIRIDLQKELLNEGYTMRVYVPYGRDWYGYNMRRLAERPANVMFVLKGIVNKK
ncbi:proline dehydrogenase family protein [Virgibacillus salarius]|uniref:proline dehydrogenase n=2 Tax=Virgibacillus salarius TaxID=447199 RepID=A0A941DPZ5_9BACI|nr:proline dehydrogenase family protein [Virgibacillus salarius]MBR7794465.1 proline dehydrogenase family protein [Virgibacillus salarius]